MKTIPTKCLSCRTEDPRVRVMTAEEVALIGYAPEDMRVCDECQTLSDSLVEFEIHRVVRDECPENWLEVNHG